MYGLRDDLEYWREMATNLEHLLITVCKYIEGHNIVDEDDISKIPGLEEVAEWWDEKKKNDKKYQTTEIRDLANGIWECYEKGTEKYIDPADVKRIVELARNAKIE